MPAARRISLDDPENGLWNDDELLQHDVEEPMDVNGMSSRMPFVPGSHLDCNDEDQSSTPGDLLAF